MVGGTEPSHPLLTEVGETDRLFQHILGEKKKKKNQLRLLLSSKAVQRFAGFNMFSEQIKLFFISDLYLEAGSIALLHPPHMASWIHL